MSTVWEVLRDAGAIAGFLSLVLGIGLALRAFGVFVSPRYEISSTYLPPHDNLGFAAMPHFVVTFENIGNVPVTFSGFEIVQPRRMFRGDTYIDHLGAELFIDGKRSSRIGTKKDAEKVDYLTTAVRLQPQDSAVEFFPLATLFPNIDTERLQAASTGPDLNPVLQFNDSFGNVYYCDDLGIHNGRWNHPEMRRLLAIGAREIPTESLIAERGRFRREWRWNRKSETVF